MFWVSASQKSEQHSRKFAHLSQVLCRTIFSYYSKVSRAGPLNLFTGNHLSVENNVGYNPHWPSYNLAITNYTSHNVPYSIVERIPLSPSSSPLPPPHTHTSPWWSKTGGGGALTWPRYFQALSGGATLLWEVLLLIAE